MRAIVYIDDGIVAAKSKAECVSLKDVVVRDLKRAGFILNVTKSCLEPQQVGKWLGFIVDLHEGISPYRARNWKA